MGKTVVQRDKLLLEVNKRLGGEYAYNGAYSPRDAPIPTGILALDRALGTGGYPRGALCGIYGPRDIGKSSSLGLNAVREAQKMSLNCGWVALEREPDREWMERHGVDPDELAIVSPETIEDAFRATHFFLVNDIMPLDFIVFDSIGAGLSDTEINGSGSSEAKPKQGGQAGIITWGIKLLTHGLRKRKMTPTILVLNQVRINMKSVQGGYMQSGGEALEHLESVIIKLLRGDPSRRVVVKDEFGDPTTVSQEVSVIIERNKHSQGSGKTAKFVYHSADWGDNRVGVDWAEDIVNTGTRIGLIKKAGSFFTLPGHEKSLQGIKQVRSYLEEHQDEREAITKAILEELHGPTGDD